MTEVAPSPRLRRGGRGRADDLSWTWSVAEGTRGRRWRSVSTSLDGRDLDWTIETGPAGRFVKIEAAGSGRLLTLHVEDDGSLHGHVVAGDGVRHLDLGVLDPPLVLVEADPLAAAAALAGLPDGTGVGERSHLYGVVVGRDLGVEVEDLALLALDGGGWEVASRAGTFEVRLDADGLLVPSDGDDGWPLEV